MIRGHLFVVGFMGAGKSSVAALLSARLQRPVIDLDDRITARTGLEITQIFSQHGEGAFRDLESEELRQVQHDEPSVIACGGGVVLVPENRNLLKTLGTVVYLQVTAGEALARIGDAETRPLLSGTGGVLAATSLLAARESLYRSVADITVDTAGKDSSEVADEIISALEGGL